MPTYSLHDGWEPYIGHAQSTRKNRWGGWEVLNRLRNPDEFQRLISDGYGVNANETIFRCHYCQKQPVLAPQHIVWPERNPVEGNGTMWWKVEQGEECEDMACRVLHAIIAGNGPWV